MKNNLTKSVVYLLVFVLASCTKYERNNPNDVLGTDGTPNVAIETYEVISDNNSDAKLQKGETATIDILVKNTGTKFTQIASAIFTSNSNKLTVTNFTLAETAISYVGKPSKIGALQIKLASNLAPGETVSCNAKLTDKAGNMFNTTLTLVISEAKPSTLSFADLEIYGLNDANGDLGDYQKGLTPELSMVIENKDAKDYEGDLIVTVTSLNASYPFQFTKTEPAYIYANDNSQIYFSLDCLPQNVPDNASLPLLVTVTDKFGGSIEYPKTIVMRTNTAKIDFTTYELWSGSPEPGSSMIIEATVINTGGRSLYFEQSGAKISTTSTYLSQLQIDLSSPAISPNQSMQNFFTIYATVKPNCPRGIQIPITVELSTSGACPTKFTSTVALNIQ